LTSPDPARQAAEIECNGSFGGTLSPNLSPRPANGSQFQPTPANSPRYVRFCNFNDLRGKTTKPRTEGSVLANRRLQPLGHLTLRLASLAQGEPQTLSVREIRTYRIPIILSKPTTVFQTAAFVEFG
jgi:hypothetical protein